MTFLSDGVMNEPALQGSEIKKEDCIMTTFQVFCKGTARRWLPYSGEFKTLEEAQACLRYAESLGNYSITGAPISYKIVWHTRQDVA